MDILAWQSFPAFNWVYFKPNLCDLQNIMWAPCPVMPQRFPVVVRPMVNLCGMGAGATVCESQSQFEESCAHGFFWTPVISGEHTSHDFRVQDGRFTTETVFRGVPLPGHFGAFQYWELLKFQERAALTDGLHVLQGRLSSYTGFLNVECIDGVIIEVHLRRGDETIAEMFPLDKIFLVPIWRDPLIDDDCKPDLETLRAQDGVLRVLVDDADMSAPECGLQRCALVVTTTLPDICEECSNHFV